MFTLLTINAAIQDVRLFSRSLYRPIGHIHERLYALAMEIERLNPDVVCLQELFHHDLQQGFYSFLRKQYPYAAGFAKKGFKLRLGSELIMLSRFPLKDGVHRKFRKAALKERIFTSKGYYKMFVEIPEAGEIQLVNFHMTAGGLNQHPESARMEKIRAQQIHQLLDNVDQDIPAMLAGDLNAGPESSQLNYKQILAAGYTDAFASSGGKGITWDPANPLVANHNERHLPPQRIDHIFINRKAVELLLSVTGGIVLKKHCVHAGGVNIPVSDHYGVCVNFSIKR